jgi:hypothetical protein
VASCRIVAMDYMHAVSPKASYTITQCFRDSIFMRSHDYDVLYGVTCPMRIMFEAASIVQGRGELQNHCHEQRAHVCTQSI